jgi:hypothetical protein
LSENDVLDPFGYHDSVGIDLIHLAGADLIGPDAHIGSWAVQRCNNVIDPEPASVFACFASISE